MLSVKSILDILLDIDLINDLVSILLQRRCKDHNLVEFGHRFNKLDTARSDQEETIILILWKQIVG